MRNLIAAYFGYPAKKLPWEEYSKRYKTYFHSEAQMKAAWDETVDTSIHLKEQTLEALKKGEFVSFVITRNNKPSWEEWEKETGMSQHRYYKGPMVSNKVYPESPPKIMLVIYKLNEGNVNEV